MPTLKEIKGRIGSVQSTLKITSAMKLVSSAKLRKAQVAIESMRPYEAQLQRILAIVSGGEGNTFSSAKNYADAPEKVSPPPTTINASVMADTDRPSSATVIVAIASNSSLCGGFNANAIAKVKELLKEYPSAVVYSVGRKMADAMRKAGYPSPADFSALADHPSFGPSADLAERLMEDFYDGKVGRVFLVYNHFVSAARQVPTVETFLSMEGDNSISSANNYAGAPGMESSPSEDYILEPSAKEIRKRLVPKTIKLKLYAALLDSAAAEHAARTIAMQTATDNGEDLLSELTLQYNKGRQQKITSEILDLASGQQ